MAKDAQGHGSEKRGGSGNGDPRMEAVASRFIPGHGVAPRSQVVAMHDNTPSVGAHIVATASMADVYREISQHAAAINPGFQSGDSDADLRGMKYG